MAIPAINQYCRQTGLGAGFDIILKIVTHKKSLRRGNPEFSDGGIEDFAIGFAVAGFAGKRHGIEEMQNFKAAHYGVRAVVEIRNNAEFESTIFQFRKDFPGLRKQNPTFGVAKPVVQVFKELIKVIDHTDFAEYAMNHVFPPSFLILNRQWTRAAELPCERGLNRLIRCGRAELTCDAAVDLADRSSRRKERFRSIEKNSAKCHVWIIT